MKNILVLVSFFFAFSLFLSCKGDAQSIQKTSNEEVQSSSLEVIQFHNEHRCFTCNLIEKLAREVVSEFEGMPFKLVNVDEKENEAFADSFEAVGTALFIYDPVTKKKKELTDFAFMNAKSSPDKFKAGMKEDILALKE